MIGNYAILNHIGPSWNTQWHINTRQLEKLLVSIQYMNNCKLIAITFSVAWKRKFSELTEFGLCRFSYNLLVAHRWVNISEVRPSSKMIFHDFIICNVCHFSHSYLTMGSSTHGPLTRYVKLRVAHALGMSGMFSPPPTSKKPLVRDACRDR